MPTGPISINVADGIENGDYAVAQCAVVSYDNSLSQQIPSGAAITLTPRMLDAGVFTVTGSGCQGLPPCSGYRMVDGSQTCGIELHAEGTGGQTQVTATATLSCPDGMTDACAAYVAQVKEIEPRGGSTATVTQPGHTQPADES